MASNYHAEYIGTYCPADQRELRNLLTPELVKEALLGCLICAFAALGFLFPEFALPLTFGRRKAVPVRLFPGRGISFLSAVV